MRCAKCDLLPSTSGTIVKNWGRTCIPKPYVQYGWFIEKNMLPIVSVYADFVYYPRGDRVLMHGHTDSTVTDIVISDDGIDLFSSSTDGYIAHWDLRLCLLFHRWQTDSKITCLAYRKCLLASGSKDGTVTVWDTHTHDEIAKYTPRTKHPVQYLEFNETGDTVFSYDGDMMAALTVDKYGCDSMGTTVGLKYLPIYKNDKLWMICSSGRVFDMDLKTQRSTALAKRVDVGIVLDRNMVDLNCDGSMIAYLLETKIVVMRWPELELVSTIEGMFDSLRFHPSNPQVIAVSGIKLYDILNRKWLSYLFVSPYTDHSQLRFTPDGSKIIAVLPGSDEIGVLDMEQAREMCKPKPPKIDLYQ